MEFCSTKYESLNYKSSPFLIWISPNKLKNNPLPVTMTGDLPFFVVKFKIECLPALWLSIAFSDTDLMLQFCLPYTSLFPKLCLIILKGYLCTLFHNFLDILCCWKHRWIWDRMCNQCRLAILYWWLHMPHSPPSATQNLCIQGEINLVNEFYIIRTIRVIRITV